MTDRYNALIVVLETDLRDDDAGPVIAAIEQIKGVLSVDPISSTPNDIVALRRVRADLSAKLWAVLYPDTKVVVS